MCLLLESIRVENKVAEALEYHQDRVDAARKTLFGNVPKLDLYNLIESQEIQDDGLFKCRIVYGLKVEDIQFIPYKIKKIKSVKLVETGAFSYNCKFLDRSFFEKLILQNTDYDELVLMRNGEITDSCFSNLVFFNGDKWLTPCRPLLEGTRRRRLIDQKRIFPASIVESNLKDFRIISFINSMLDLGDLTIDVSAVY
jgi:4-amino-4-deoxychorismate lyase